MVKFMQKVSALENSNPESGRVRGEKIKRGGDKTQW